VRYLLLLLLAGCASAPAEPVVSVVWNRVDDPHAVCESLSGRKTFFHIRGCAQRNGKVCSIYAPAPRSEEDLQRFATLGHELLHCFDGNWHDQWGRMNNPPRRVARNAPDSAAAGGTTATE
jgi:hypothetical protein